MRCVAVLVACLAAPLSACSVIGVAADAASLAGTVVSTTVSVAGDAVDAAAHAVNGSSSDQQDQEKKVR
jgi:hypothetical protein